MSQGSRAKGVAPEADVRSSVHRGLAWSLLGNAVLRLGTFAMSLVLARLLAPSDFGTYAVGLTYLQIAIICNDVGVTSALVQWRGSFSAVLPTARSMTYLTTTLIAVVMFLGSGTLASFSGNPGARPVLMVLSSSVILDGLMAVSTAKMWREFRQKHFIAASLAGFAAQAGVSISLAAAGAGAMSFAVGMAVDAAVRFVLISSLAGAPFTPGFDRAIARRLVTFGVPLASGLGVQAVLLNVDYLVISRMLDSTALGFYALAFNISGWVPGVLGTALGTVTLAGFSRLAEQGTEELSVAARQAFTVLGKTLFPVVAILVVCAPHIITVAYGSRWLPSAAPLAWLAAYIIPRMFAQTATELMVAQGRTRTPVLINLGWLACLVPGLAVGTTISGIQGAAAAQALVGCVVAVPLLIVSVRHAGVDLSGLVTTLARPALGAIAAGGAALGVATVLGPLAPLPALALLTTVIVVAYVGLGLDRADHRRIVKALRRSGCQKHAEEVTS